MDNKKLGWRPCTNTTRLRLLGMFSLITLSVLFLLDLLPKNDTLIPKRLQNQRFKPVDSVASFSVHPHQSETSSALNGQDDEDQCRGPVGIPQAAPIQKFDLTRIVSNLFLSKYIERIVSIGLLSLSQSRVEPTWT